MTHLPQLRASLVKAAERQRHAQNADHATARAGGSGRPARRWAWLRSLRRPASAIPLLAAVAVTLAVAVVALTTIGHGHPGGPRSAAGPAAAHRRQELGYLQAADQKVLRTHACRARVPAVPALSQGSPPAALLATLGVLRRPATIADTFPGSLQDKGGLRGIYVRYIRRARVVNGVSYYVVPAASLPDLVPPTGCDAAIVAALHAELPRIPASLRAPTVALQAQMIARQREIAQEAASGGVCLMFASVDGRGGTCGATASQVEQRGLVSAYGLLSGVVPDGVATVTIHYPASNGLAALTVTADVVGNVFVTSVSPSTGVVGHLGSVNLHPAMIWRSATGAIVRTVPAGRGNATLAYGSCRAKHGSNAC